jgi:hypothetical protein
VRCGTDGGELDHSHTGQGARTACLYQVSHWRAGVSRS